MARSGRKISLVTDSSCDLPLHLLERFKIVVVPLVVHLGADSYLDGELSTEEFWAKTAEERAAPQTSQPSVGTFEEVFEGLVERGKAAPDLPALGWYLRGGFRGLGGAREARTLRHPHREAYGHN